MTQCTPSWRWDAAHEGAGAAGAPQGSVVSPLLSVIYINRFLKHWRLSGRGEVFRSHVVSYADDCVPPGRTPRDGGRAKPRKSGSRKPLDPEQGRTVDFCNTAEYRVLPCDILGPFSVATAPGAVTTEAPQWRRLVRLLTETGSLWAPRVRRRRSWRRGGLSDANIPRKTEFAPRRRTRQKADRPAPDPSYDPGLCEIAGL